MQRCRALYGDAFSLRIAQEGTWVMLSAPEAVKQVFTGDPEVLRAGEANLILRPFVGRRSVLLLDEPAHMVQRKLMLPPFHGERMQRYGALMRDVAEREVDSWPSGEPVALWPRMQEITLEVIMRAVFGFAEGSRLDRLRELLRHMLDWTTSRRQMVAMAILGPDRIERNRDFRAVLDPVDALLFEEIRARRGDPALAGRDDILSLLLQARHEDGAAMSDHELRDELMTLLVAGHETTATSLAWALERLLRHPESLDRLRDEVAAGRTPTSTQPSRRRYACDPCCPSSCAGSPSRWRSAAGHCRRASRSRRASTSCTVARTSTRSPSASGPSASSSDPPEPTPGSPSGAECVAASERASPSSR